MIKYTKIQSIRITEIQKKTLNKLRDKYKINPQKFIRDAIAEKLEKDYKCIIEKEIEIKCPF